MRVPTRTCFIAFVDFGKPNTFSLYKLNIVWHSVHASYTCRQFYCRRIHIDIDSCCFLFLPYKDHGHNWTCIVK